MIICPKCQTPWSREASSCPNCQFERRLINGLVAWAPELAQGGGGFEASFFEDLANLEDRNFWFRARNEILLWALSKYCEPVEHFLEIGCGTGYVLKAVAKAYPQARMVGSEVFIEGLSIAAERVPGAEFVQMDARAMPYCEEFDTIGAFDVLEHIDDDRRVLANLFNSLKPNGHLIIAVPQHMWLWSAMDDVAHHERRYGRLEMQSKMSEAGFEVVRSTSFVSLLLPLMALTRMRKSSVETLDITAEMRLNPFVNKALETILQVERGFIRAGLNMPCGGSRLVIARKPKSLTSHKNAIKAKNTAPEADE